jgi:nucleotide-binding universal stress UspA family protein
MLRSVLVALDGSAYSETATALAIDWARRYDARLLGLGVVDAPSIQGAEPVPLGAGAYKQARDEAWLADAHRRVVNFLADFRARSEAADIAVEVLEDIGNPAVRILREAHRCDVVILARETRFHFETQEKPDRTLDQVLRGSPRPSRRGGAAPAPGARSPSPPCRHVDRAVARPTLPGPGRQTGVLTTPFRRAAYA